MKLTNTLRTIAFSGLGLLAGASTLTLQADSAQAMSSYQAFGTNLVDTQMTLRTWAPSPRTGVFKVSSQCGEWAAFNGSMQMKNFCPGVVTFQMHRLSDNTFLGEQEVELDGREFVGELEHLVEEAIVIKASYARGTKVVNNETHKYTPPQVSKEVVLVCNPTHDDLSIDGSDQNCDVVDGLNVDGDRFASV
ncbi:MAG: hypothetical protein VX210_10795, partial [Myxococcota bacterium]|nr:hypothetical protein [Myxococcota bacterium]